MILQWISGRLVVQHNAVYMSAYFCEVLADFSFCPKGKGHAPGRESHLSPPEGNYNPNLRDLLTHLLEIVCHSTVIYIILLIAEHRIMHTEWMPHKS
jgi:hypothetical protein